MGAAEEHRKPPTMGTYGRLRRFLADHAWGFAVVVLCSFLAAGLTTVYAYMAGPALAWLFAQETPPSLTSSAHGLLSALPAFVHDARYAPAVFAVGLVILTALRGATQYAQAALAAGLREGLARRLRVDLLGHLLQSASSVHHRYGAGDMAARVTGDVKQVAAVTTLLIATGLTHLVRLPMLLGVAYGAHPGLTLAALACLPAIAGWVWLQARRVRRAWSTALVADGRVSGDAAHLSNLIEVINAYTCQQAALGRFARQVDTAARNAARAQRAGAALGPLSQLLGSVALSGTLLWAAYGLEPRPSAATMVSFGAAVLLALSSIQTLVARGGMVASALAAVGRLDEVFALPTHGAPPVRTRAPGLAPLRVEQLTVRFGRQTVLDDVSLTLEPGETVALVGASGSGKTTLIRALLGLVEPASGRVWHGERPLDVPTRRPLFGWVPQEPLLFAGTLEENITLWETRPDAARLRWALREADLAVRVASLPRGLDTPISEQGAPFSAGERQRICLARALYREAPFLLLDEVTAGLDAHSEAVVTQTLDSLMGRHGALVISHRLSTVLRAQRALVLEHGRIVEAGTPAELLAAPTRFAALLGARHRHEGPEEERDAQATA